MQTGQIIASIEAIDSEIGSPDEKFESTRVTEMHALADQKSDDEILADLEIKMNNELDEDQQVKLKHLVAANADIFAKSIAD